MAPTQFQWHDYNYEEYRAYEWKIFSQHEIFSVVRNTAATVLLLLLLLLLLLQMVSLLYCPSLANGSKHLTNSTKSNWLLWNRDSLLLCAQMQADSGAYAGYKVSWADLRAPETFQQPTSLRYISTRSLLLVVMPPSHMQLLDGKLSSQSHLCVLNTWIFRARLVFHV